MNKYSDFGIFARFFTENAHFGIFAKKTKPQVFVLDILRVGFVVGAPILEGVEDGFEGFAEVLATIPTENQVEL